MAVCNFIFKVVDEYARGFDIDMERVKEDFEMKAEQSGLSETKANILTIGIFIWVICLDDF